MLIQMFISRLSLQGPYMNPPHLISERGLRPGDRAPCGAVHRSVPCIVAEAKKV